ncbi:MAG: hypothetical protein ACRDJP_14275 [Actinomycetota bacterium]
MAHVITDLNDEDITTVRIEMPKALTDDDATDPGGSDDDATDGDTDDDSTDDSTDGDADQADS